MRTTFFVLQWQDGRRGAYGSYEAARAAVVAEHPDAKIGHGARNLAGGGNRALYWASERASRGEGPRAIAAIRRVQV